MAHVLLPCDLPFWPEAQQHLSQVKICKDEGQLAQHMTNIHSVCCVSLDPEEDVQPQPRLFQELGSFVREGLSEEERSRLFSRTLPAMASLASRLSQLKPPSGFLYSLRNEERSFQVERELVASLLANAFFSTFPRRNSKTHPTLQDFNFAHFFPNLNKRSHQKRLKAFFRYFERLESRRGVIHFTRKIVKGPSLPGWLCSDRPLLPLRTEDHPLPTQVLQACSSAPQIGGDVLKASMSKEARLFFAYPELMVILCFVESLSDSEVLVVEGIDQGLLECPEQNFCFADFNVCSNHRLEDQLLLNELNKALVAFSQEVHLRIRSRISSLTSDSKDSSFGDTRHSKDFSSIEKGISLESSSGESFCRKLSFGDRSVSKELSFGERSSSKRTSSSERKLSRGSSLGEKNSFKVSPDEKNLCFESKGGRKWSLSKGDSIEERSKQFKADKDQRRSNTDSSCSIKLSTTRSASQSSGRSVKTSSLQLKEEEHYYTADDDSEDGCCDDVASSRSAGFVLGEHERLEDFRKRIRKRTRRRMSRRRSSSSSYLSSSSDMEDISEENPEEIRFIRGATSEPSLVAAVEGEEQRESLLSCQAAETLLLRGRKMMVTSSDGRLKAYSYDGVNPNLPVPFKAKFRRRRIPEVESLVAERRIVVLPCEERACQLKVIIMWLAASMAETEFCLPQVTPAESQLKEISRVYSKVVSRGWTIGDLSCEVLRYCRNSLSTRSITDLFTQLMGGESLRQPSLD